MAGNQNVISGRERDLSAVGETEGGAPFHQQHPFVRLLVNQKPGGDAWPRETIRSIRRSPDRTISVQTSSGIATGISANRFLTEGIPFLLRG
jgi:hypothetical protein